MHDRGVQKRIWFVTALLFIALCVLGVKLSYLHLANHTKLIREYKRTLMGLRGRIFDCNGNQFPMAVSLPARLFYVDPQSFNKEHNKHQIAKTVADALNLNEAEVLAKFTQTDSRYIKLGISDNDRVFDLLGDKKHISGIGSEEIVIRSYQQRLPAVTPPPVRVACQC